MAKIRLSRVESSAFKNSSYAGPSVIQQMKEVSPKLKQNIHDTELLVILWALTVEQHRHSLFQPVNSSIICVIFFSDQHNGGSERSAKRFKNRNNKIN